MRTDYSIISIQEAITKLYREGRNINYVLGWLKGLNESDRFSDQEYQILQEYAIELYVFELRIQILSNK